MSYSVCGDSIYPLPPTSSGLALLTRSRPFVYIYDAISSITLCCTLLHELTTNKNDSIIRLSVFGLIVCVIIPIPIGFRKLLTQHLGYDASEYLQY
jgi:hypothetical protein